MARYLIRRIILLVPTIIVISMISFVIIQLPPGDFLTSYIAQLQSTGESIDQAQIDSLKEQYGLGQPIYIQYTKWMVGVVQGDFGWSLGWNMPVKDLIWERLALTFVISLAALLFNWVIALPVGIFSAIRQYSIGDYLATLISFVGVGIPNFLLALVVMWLAYSQLGITVGGLFSAEYADAPWSWAKVNDLLQHLLIPMIVLGVAGTASLIRIMRANLLDELHKPYVTTARAKGLSETELILRYPVRVALNPFISTIGWSLPGLVSGSIIVSVVLNLPTTGPLLLRALVSQDMYLAGSFVLIMSTLTVIGTLISDIILAWLDPRIRLE